MTPLLFNVPHDVGGWLEWGSIHQFDHFATSAGIFARLGQIVAVFPLDPVPLNQGIVAWSRAHQAVHSEENALLGITGSDLTGVDFRQPERLRIWIELHAREHMEATAVLEQMAASS